jgi:peptide-methionine (S)-S-oxide reductase
MPCANCRDAIKRRKILRLYRLFLMKQNGICRRIIQEKEIWTKSMNAIALLTLWFSTGLFIPPYVAVRTGDMAMETVNQTELATFAGGCFWGTEYAYEKVPGVIKTEVGFMGGKVDDPSYKRVCVGDTMHAEVVHLTFDPAKVSYRKLVEYFFKIHDPTTMDRQGPDVGTQYRSAIFFHSPEQEQIAKDVIAELTQAKAFRRPIVTQVVAAQEFWKAEGYHQQYFDKNPARAEASCHFIPKFEP